MADTPKKVSRELHDISDERLQRELLRLHADFGLSRSEIARATNISPVALEKIESGESQPDRTTRRKLLNYIFEQRRKHSSATDAAPLFSPFQRDAPADAQHDEDPEAKNEQD